MRKSPMAIRTSDDPRWSTGTALERSSTGMMTAWSSP